LLRSSSERDLGLNYMMHSCGWVEVGREIFWSLLLRDTRIATERSVNRRSGGGQTCRRPGNPLGARQRPHHHAAVHRLCSKSRAGRPCRSVRSMVNSRKCRPGIKTMCAGYRAFRSPWRAVHYGDAPGRPFPRALRDPELQPRGRNLQCLPAGFDFILQTCSTNWCSGEFNPALPGCGGILSASAEIIR